MTHVGSFWVHVVAQCTHRLQHGIVIEKVGEGGRRGMEEKEVPNDSTLVQKSVYAETFNGKIWTLTKS